jgi:propionaldehyde dehydrogenase
MNFDTELVETIVKRVVSEISSRDATGETTPAWPGRPDVTDGIFEDMDMAITAAARAQRSYLARPMADRRRFIEAIRTAVVRPENLTYMSEQAVEDTGMGNPLDKYLKNKYAAELSPGVEDLVTDAWSGDSGLTTVEYSPYGVIGAIAPTTNPTETIISNTIGMLSAGNSVVFSPHPRAKNVSLWLIRLLNEALAAEGAPPNLVVAVKQPSVESTQAMIGHPDVRMLVATGGPVIVDMVLRSGKKAIGAGAGNPPAVVDATADLEKAAEHIVDGASFDNNLPCIAEKEVIVVDSVADTLILHMKKVGAYEVRDPDVLSRLVELVVGPEGPRAEWVGKSAVSVLAAVGVEAPAQTRLVIAQTDGDHPFVQRELMMPILPIVRVSDVHEAIALAVEVEHGNRHTACMHSQDVSMLTKMARLIQTTLFVKNGPSYAGIGIGGEGYCTFTIAGPTGEGLTSARSFARRRRCVLVGDLNVR